MLKISFILPEKTGVSVLDESLEIHDSLIDNLTKEGVSLVTFVVDFIGVLKKPSVRYDFEGIQYDCYLKESTSEATVVEQVLSFGEMFGLEKVFFCEKGFLDTSIKVH